MSKAQIEAVAQMIAIPEEEPSVAEQRGAMEQMAAAFPFQAQHSEAVEMGGVSCEWIWDDTARDDVVLLYFHGGGYCLGSIATHRNLIAALAKAAGVRALAVDYRLAPENPFPAAVEDAVAVYTALLEQGRDPSKIAVAGDSAGGGLSLALMLSARERDMPQPTCAALLSPWTDMRAAGESFQTRRDADPMIVRDRLLVMVGRYVGAASTADPLVSPVLADLSGLAPLLIHAGDAELLLSDSTDLAKRAEAAGVDVEIKVWDDMVHVFQAFYPLVDEGRESIAEIGAFIRERTA
ncbi:alpha/beta hydrolase [Parasphingopyxis algicola]|uniref:alpha/beta hydrolase n=1 Tax=Parasphingopyxis algicola TaxID=2026624 RepID=UPI0015A3851A|nr:alpha/beta hydrolase [Parasphingopyxis algicola]QLC25671.1 alpha/beta hydrolase [Parasphingopyxis algicola]